MKYKLAAATLALAILAAIPVYAHHAFSAEFDNTKRACLHAKCVVIDQKHLFISSANFTEAAQERNIEVGVLIHSHLLPGRVAGHFESLVAEGKLLPMT